MRRLSAARRVYVLGLVLLLLRAELCGSQRFLSQNKASQFLLRHRRANTLFEEGKKGNLERECIEELCNKEEAREIFENNLETEYFYPKYVVCLGSHRVGINNPVERGIPQNLRTCVQGDLVLVSSVTYSAILMCVFWTGSSCRLGNSGKNKKAHFHNVLFLCTNVLNILKMII